MFVRAAVRCHGNYFPDYLSSARAHTDEIGRTSIGF